MKTTNDDEPVMRFVCEAREAGRESFEFPTVDGETARAVCDASGYEFIRCYELGGDSDRPRNAPAKGDAGLSKKQLQTLVIEANKTHRALSRMGVVTDGFDVWRHAQVYQCVRREGLSQCQSSQYRKLLAHFKGLRGESVTGAAAAGPQQWSREGGDTVDRREQLLALLDGELRGHARRVENPQTDAEVAAAATASMKGGVIGEGYVLTMARAKNPGWTLYDMSALVQLPASRLEHLLYTVRNRIAAREGRGKTSERNAKQRGKTPKKGGDAA